MGLRKRPRPVRGHHQITRRTRSLPARTAHRRVGAPARQRSPALRGTGRLSKVPRFAASPRVQLRHLKPMLDRAFFRSSFSPLLSARADPPARRHPRRDSSITSRPASASVLRFASTPAPVRFRRSRHAKNHLLNFSARRRVAAAQGSPPKHQSASWVRRKISPAEIAGEALHVSPSVWAATSSNRGLARTTKTSPPWFTK